MSENIKFQESFAKCVLEITNFTGSALKSRYQVAGILEGAGLTSRL